MKMTQAHFEHLKQIINATGENTQARWLEYKASGMSNMRFRWDLLYCAGATNWVCKILYNYLNDEHIDTALKAIVVSE